MERKKEESKETQRLETLTLEKEIEELKGELFALLRFCIPPAEVRQEVMRNLYTIPLSLLKICRTLIDYEIKLLEERIQETQKTQKSRRIKIE
ncbi:MAG: hypothetical protein GXO04_04475 [Aquificae bacterium]|nr:hypothetical protein [Aquificota bacterium]